MDLSHLSASGSNSRQKRVLPTRSRRGGPGVGSCETDLLILEHRKRRSAIETTLPSTTPLLLTTDSKHFSSINNDLRVSITSSERYFDRPDVIEGFRKRLVIQTPSYKEGLPDVGRFRPRGAEDIQVDTSDAAYERRHKKYETFERRQRFREKEKLKHEQYKLKERVEQLRIMDASAFLALPASDFSSAPDAGEDDADAGTAALVAAHINGSNVHNEGERRRKEMLDIALSLEARFRVLLPPDRVRKSQPRPAMREDNATTSTTSIFRRSASDAEMSEKEEEVISADSHNLRQDRIKAKSAEKDSAYESPASALVSRVPERSDVIGLSPVQKPEQRHSRVVLSCSLSPVISPRLAEGPVMPPADPTPERSASHYIGIEELPEQEEHLGPESEEEVEPLSLCHEQFISASDQIVESVEVHLSTNSQTWSSVPSQKHTPLFDVQPLIALPEADQHRSSPMYIDVGHLAKPSVPLHFPSPPPIATLSDAFPSQFQKTESATRRRPGRPPKHSQQKSRLLELAEVVQSISMPPLTKRKRTSHDNPSLKSPIPSPVSYETAEPNEESMIVISSNERRSRSPPPEQPSGMRDAVALFTPPYSSISVSGSRRSSARRGVTIAEYQSDTGELRWTTTPLLVAAIRGSQRQTQRHQMAFGVKVPDQVMDPYDFWLPDEYLPQEELQKYNN